MIFWLMFEKLDSAATYSSHYYLQLTSDFEHHEAAVPKLFQSTTPVLMATASQWHLTLISFVFHLVGYFKMTNNVPYIQ